MVHIPSMRIARAVAAAALRPIVFCLLLVGAGLAVHQPWISAAGAVVLWALSAPALASRIIGLLERRFPSVEISAVPPAEAVAVIGGNIIRGLPPSGIQWGPSMNRFSDALRLVRARKAPFLILSAADSPHDRTRSQADILADAAVEFGIAREVILITRRITNSAEEVAAIADLCQERQIESIIVVTSAWHMPRIMLLFRRTSLRVFPFPVDKRAGGSGWVPTARALADSEAAIHELAAVAWRRRA